MDTAFATFEALIRDNSNGIRFSLVTSLRAMLGSDDADTELSDLIEIAYKADQQVRRKAALLILRALGEEHSLSPEEEGRLRLNIIKLCIQAVPDVMKSIGVSERDQGHISIEKCRGLLNQVRASLEPIRHAGDKIESILASRQEITKSVKAQKCKSFLVEYDIVKYIHEIDTIFSFLSDMADCRDYTLPDKINALRSLLQIATSESSESASFFTDLYYLPFLRGCGVAVASLESTVLERLSCDIECGVSLSRTLEKRYPLSEPGRQIRIIVPFRNKGPGTAYGLSMQVMTDSDAILVNYTKLILGDIRPGTVTFAFDALVIEPTQEVNFEIFVSWNVVGAAAKEKDFSVKVIGQQSSVDWDYASTLEPYSTEVARGEEFVGRQEKVASLVARLRKTKMESSYITGQKRVGKSSLALAVKDRITDGGGDLEYYVTYAEWGEYAATSSQGTLRSLGQSLADFLLSHLPIGIAAPQNLDFNETLSPLIRILATLEQHAPKKRFAFILDEFDDIHPDLYRIGPLADTLFANIRSIAAKPNVAFLFVGGEKMPYVISAQGDQLNRFVKEELSYFSRSAEWNDYDALVRKPTEGILNWHESAVNALFDETNGHPYFTKLICKSVFQNAIRERDNDITDAEVSRAYAQNTSLLDTNSFSHIWKDGINGAREDEEIKSLQRCRVLVAIGRVLRESHPIDEDNIIRYKRSTELSDAEVLPILNEFCRRGIMQEIGGRYDFTLPLFRDWLAEVGVSRLIADTLGDELAAARAKEEELAVVRSEEIRELVTHWGPYRGMPVQSEDVRLWLDQVPSRKDQRLLFNILKHIRFFREGEIQEKLKVAHRKVSQVLPEFVRRSKKQTRNDVLLTYVDGPAKSGSEYAQLYAEVNLISSQCVVEMGSFANSAAEHERLHGVTVQSIIVVDDIVGTGGSIIKNVKNFIENNASFLQDRDASVFVIALTGTAEGIDRVRSAFGSIERIKVDLQVCSPLDDKSYAFKVKPGIWGSEDEYYAAKSTCQSIGLGVVSHSPLGFGDQGLLVVFPRTVPNNSLPIVHSDGRGDNQWRALFPRPKN